MTSAEIARIKHKPTRWLLEHEERSGVFRLMLVMFKIVTFPLFVIGIIPGAFVFGNYEGPWRLEEIRNEDNPTITLFTWPPRQFYIGSVCASVVILAPVLWLPWITLRYILKGRKNG